MSEYTIVNGELYHYGVKGMKWGVRRAQKKEYGLSKRQLKKQIKNSSDDNIKKVTKEWSSELLGNSRYAKLGKQSNEVAKALLKSEERDYRNNTDDDISKRTKDLYKKHSQIDKEMTKIEIDIGNKYVQKFNDARLKDIAYSGTVEKGRKMLETYGKNYTVWNDGTIRSGNGLGIKSMIYDYDNRYIRPNNL